MANVTFDGDIQPLSHPSQPWLAALFTERVPPCIRLSRIIILLDSACTVHIVTESWLLDDFVIISPEKIQWKNSQHVIHAFVRGTPVTRNMLLDRTTRVKSFEGFLYVLRFGTDLLSVKKLFAKATRNGMHFRSRAKFLDANNNLMGYSREPLHRSDL